MVLYSQKLLELVWIENGALRAGPAVQLTFAQGPGLTWEIDSFTDEQLSRLAAFSKNYKYRLSLYSFCEPGTNQYYSCLTKTFQDQSEKMLFPCSAEYAETLNAIQASKNAAELLALPSFSVKEAPRETTASRVEKLEFPGFRRKKVGLALAAIAVSASIFLGYSQHPSGQKTEFSKETAMLSTSFSEKALPHTKSSLIPVNNETRKSDEADKEEMNRAEQPIPVIELDGTLAYSVPEGSVALTFDDGPSQYTKAIADILKEYHVGGTFFFVGQNVRKYPAFVQYVNEAGFSIGNHSANHANFSRLAYKQQERELTDANRLIEEITAEPVVLFRPPYGAKDQATLDLMSVHNQKIVLWNKDTEDWRNKNSKQIFDYVVRSGASGSIILLHETRATVEALPKIIEHLQSQKLQLVNLK